MLRCDVSIAKKATPTTVTDDEPNLKVANICISFLSQLLFSENPFLLCPIYYPIGWSVQQSSPCTETRQKLYIDATLDFFLFTVCCCCCCCCAFVYYADENAIPQSCRVSRPLGRLYTLHKYRQGNTSLYATCVTNTGVLGRRRCLDAHAACSWSIFISCREHSRQRAFCIETRISCVDV